MLQSFNLSSWQASISHEIRETALDAIESGKVIYCPQLAFELRSDEDNFLSTHYASPKTKNISFDPKTGNLQGAICTKTEYFKLTEMLSRYAQASKNLVQNLFPHYKEKLEQGRTSFRPIEIAGRKPSSYRKDDTRLHVDAFPSTPLQGKRILRVFTNVNPNQQPRVWRLGAPFPKVVEYFYPKLTKPFWGSAFWLNFLKITKTHRSLYDHYMLQLHNEMKADLAYQKQVPQSEVLFNAGSSWIVYTDQVSHAAMSGQFTFEQTFYLPAQALANIEQSPCKVLEGFLKKRLL